MVNTNKLINDLFPLSDYRQALELTTDLVVAKQVHSRIKEKGYDAILVEGYDDDGFWHRPHTLKIRND